MNFNEEQKTAILSPKPLVVISAGAGSGKTRVLTERFIFLCEKKLQERLGNESSPIAASVDEIVAITFTEKAAREMKDRIRGRIEEKRSTVIANYSENEMKRAELFWQEQKEALDGALITTFHSFCHKLIHEYALSADVPPNFTVLDDVLAKLLQIDIFEEMFDSPEKHRNWKKIYEYYSRNQLTEAIKAVYSQMKEIPMKEASIGEYFKCDEIIQLQLAQIELERQQTLMNFYKNTRAFVGEFDESDKVCKKIKNHYDGVGDYSFQNVDSLFEEILEAFPKKITKTWADSNPPLFELYEFHFKPLKEKWKTLKLPTKQELEELKEIMSIFVNMLIVFDEAYSQKKRDRAALDFSDLQQKAIKLLENKEISAKCRQKYKHMMIDEFQDTNQLQMDMLRSIQPFFQFVVGDGKQSIYRFRGADVSLMKELVEFAKQDENSEFVNMSTNYRTCDSIIQFVNALFNEIMGSEEKETNAAYKINYTNINSHRNGTEEKACRVELIQIPLEDDAESEEEETDSNQSEFEVLANRMLALIEEKQPIVAMKDEGWRAPEWRDFAVLIQARTELTKLEKALKDKKIPYVVYGGIGFYEKQEVRDMLTLLRWIARPWEPLHILAVLRSPFFGVNVEGFLTIHEKVTEEETSFATYIYEEKYLDDQTIDPMLKASLDKLKQFFDQFVPYTPQVSLREYLYELFTQTGLKQMLLVQRNNIQLIKNVEKLIETLASFRASSLDHLLSQLDQLAKLSEKEGEAEVELAEGNMVHIMTVHASKGLEFPIVFLPGLAKSPKGDSGSIRFDKDVRLALEFKVETEPFKKPDEKCSPSFKDLKVKAKDQAVEEAKRLFYVAVTRAKDYLVLTTIDKTPSNSWHEMLQKALEETTMLESKMKFVWPVAEREKWEDKGEEYHVPKLIQTKFISPSFSVSEIMTFMKDPKKYYEKYIIKIEDVWVSNEITTNRLVEETISSFSGATLGTVVHRICELLDNGYDILEAKEEALSMIEDELERERYEKEAEPLIQNYSLLDEFQLGETWATEWSFIIEIEGAQIIGEIDKITVNDGSFHLIDLKTNKQLTYDQLIAYYTPQLYLYKLAFEQKEKKKVEKLSLFFMRGGKEGFHTITIDPNIEHQIKETVRRMVLLKERGAGKEEYVQ